MAVAVGQRCVVRIQITDINLRNARDIAATVESPQYVAHCQGVSFDEVSGVVYVSVDVNSVGSWSMWLGVRFAEEMFYTPSFVFAEVEGDAKPCDAPYIVDVEVAGESVSVTPPKVDVDAITREEFEQLSKDVAGKVDKVEGKGLSTNDFTDEYKKKVDEFIIDTELSPTSDNAISNSAVVQGLAGLAEGVSEAIGNVAKNVEQNTADIKTKQSTLTLTTKPNGNIVIGNLAGQSKEFMPATPSGVPEHYTWLAMNGVTYGTFTGTDGNTYGQEGKWGVYAEYGGLADLTDKDMRQVIVDRRQLTTNNNSIQAAISARTNLIASTDSLLISGYSFSGFLRGARNIEIANIVRSDNPNGYFEPSNISYMFQNCIKMHTVLGTISGRYVNNTTNCFLSCSALKEVRISGLKVSISFANSPLSVESATYLLQNADSTEQFTITFRADRQAIYEANTDFVTAKNAKTNITILYQ